MCLLFLCIFNYNHSCMYSRQNKIEEAFDLLKKAVNKGIKDWDF